MRIAAGKTTQTSLDYKDPSLLSGWPDLPTTWHGARLILFDQFLYRAYLIELYL